MIDSVKRILVAHFVIAHFLHCAPLIHRIPYGHTVYAYTYIYLQGLSLANLARFYAMEEEAVASAEGSKTPRGAPPPPPLYWLAECLTRPFPFCVPTAGAGHLTPRNESELSKTFFALFPTGQSATPIALDNPAADDE